ncbi:MAG: 3-phosphoshikimate 1-carboxyvinyltransferase [Candidatus Dormibacteria bacterium]
MTELRISPAAHVDATLPVPGDKSISHRALILGSQTRGRSYIGNLSPAADVESTAAALRACGAAIRPFGDGRVSLDGAGIGRTLTSPPDPIDCGNSGTTMRLLAGVLAGSAVHAVLDGDESLRRRPMERVAAPLRAMGADVSTAAGRPPVRVRGVPAPRGGRHQLDVASAQVKSAILLCGLTADGPVTVSEPLATRDHTERMLRMCGVRVDSTRDGVTLVPSALAPFGMRVPGDISSAAFALALVAARPGWRLRCENVGLNPGRTGIIDVLRHMGADLVVSDATAADDIEPAGDIELRGRGLQGVDIGGALVPRCIDELPAIAVLATQCEGTTTIRDAAELRLKESDRIAMLAAGLRAFGARVEEQADGLAVQGPTPLHSARVDGAADHRLVMAFAVAAALATPDVSIIDGAEAAAVSWPTFAHDFVRLTAGK